MPERANITAVVMAQPKPSPLLDFCSPPLGFCISLEKGTCPNPRQEGHRPSINLNEPPSENVTVPLPPH